MCTWPDYKSCPIKLFNKSMQVIGNCPYTMLRTNCHHIKQMNTKPLTERTNTRLFHTTSMLHHSFTQRSMQNARTSTLSGIGRRMKGEGIKWQTHILRWSELRYKWHSLAYRPTWLGRVIVNPRHSSVRWTHKVLDLSNIQNQRNSRCRKLKSSWPWRLHMLLLLLLCHLRFIFLLMQLMLLSLD